MDDKPIGEVMETKKLSISEVAQTAGCRIKTVREYERKGLMRPLKSGNKDRRYSLDEALHLKQILQFTRAR